MVVVMWLLMVLAHVNQLVSPVDLVQVSVLRCDFRLVLLLRDA